MTHRRSSRLFRGFLGRMPLSERVRIPDAIGQPQVSRSEKQPNYEAGTIG
jgi:hypothetical protein